MAYKYDKDRFRGETVQELAQIILTGDTKGRWERETPVFADSMIEHMQISSETVLLDFGVGIGRMAKALIDKTGCKVVGVDISPDMLRQSMDYVAHENYSPLSFNALQSIVKNRKVKVDGVYSVWVLQHCDFKPAYESILGVLPTGSNFFIANTKNRCVPVDGDRWANDGMDIRATIRQHFDLRHDATEELTPVLPKDHHGHIFCDYLLRK